MFYIFQRNGLQRILKLTYFEINIPNGKNIIGTVYRPPNYNTRDFLFGPPLM